MFTPQDNDDVIGILREYNPRAIVENPGRIQETWVNSDVQIPTQEQYDAAKASLEQKRAAQIQARNAYQAALDQGYTIPGTNIVLSVSEKALTNFNSLASHLERKFAKNEITNSTIIPIPDKDGVIHPISYEDFDDMLIPYGDRCNEVFFMNI